MRQNACLLLFGSAVLLVPARGFAQDADDGSAVSELVVTAAPYVVSLDSTTTSVDVIRREALDEAPPAGLGDVLASTPGVRSSFFGPGASRPVIRGLAGPRVMVLTNGVGLIDASSLSPDHQVAADPQEAERIEVLRGPAALAYGGSAIGGVVNILDQRIATDYEAGVHGRLLASGSSVDEGGQGSFALRAGLGGGWSATLDGLRRSTGNYDVPVDPMSDRLAADLGLPPPPGRQSVVANSWSRLSAGGLGLSRSGEGGFAGVAIKQTEAAYGSPAEEDVHIALRQTRLDARGAANIARGVLEKVQFAGGYADYKHTEFEGPDVGTVFLSQGYETRLEAVQRQRGGWQGAFGLQTLHRTFDAVGEEALIPSTRIDEAGLFTLQRGDFGQWGLEGGARLDRRRLDSVAGRRSFTDPSASIAAFVRPAEGWFAGVSPAYTSRAPTEEELFSDGPHPATGAFQVGDPGLGRENSTSVEVSLHRSGKALDLDLHLYQARYDSFIELVPTGAIDAGSGLPVFHFIQTRALYRGAELEASREVWRDGERTLRLKASGDMVRGDLGGGPAVRTPPWSLAIAAEYQGTDWRARLGVRHVAGQDRVAAFEVPTDGYTLVDASVSVAPLAAKPDLRVFLDGSNLTNVEAREHASFLKDVAPLPGRSLRGGLSYRF